MKYLVICIIAAFPLFGYAQSDSTKTKEPAMEVTENGYTGAFDTKNWLRDDLTVKFGEGVGKMEALAGIRILFEPQLGIPFISGNNKLASNQLNAIPKFALETNLVKGYIAFQGFVLFPSKVSFDEKSPVLTKGIISTNEVGLNAGFGWGLTFLDGIIALGHGRLNYDNRDFDKSHPDYSNKLLKTGFWFINVQPVSAVRKAIKSARKE